MRLFLLYYYRNSLALYKFILYGQMDVKLIMSEKIYLFKKNLQMQQINYKNHHGKARTNE